jgi:hypothetical protein
MEAAVFKEQRERKRFWQMASPLLPSMPNKTDKKKVSPRS